MDDFDLILEDLKIKGLFLIGGKGSGKTKLAQYLARLAKEKWGEEVDIRCFDPSTAWWHHSPLRHRQSVDEILRYTNQPGTLYAIGKLSKDQVKTFLSKIIGDEYYRRHDGVLLDEGFLSCQPLSLIILEEAQDITKKARQPEVIAKWTNEGRNLDMTGIYTTQRPAEVDTSIIERCNLLVGYIEGHNNKRKVEGATSSGFMRKLKEIKPKSYEFLYYNGEVHGPIKGDDVYYPSPRGLEAQVEVQEVQEVQQRGQSSALGWILLLLFLMWMIVQALS